MWNKVVPLTPAVVRRPMLGLSSLSLSPPFSLTYAHGVHAVPCQRCGANTEIARAGLDEGPDMPTECSRPSAMT